MSTALEHLEEGVAAYRRRAADEQRRADEMLPGLEQARADLAAAQALVDRLEELHASRAREAQAWTAVADAVEQVVVPRVGVYYRPREAAQALAEVWSAADAPGGMVCAAPVPADAPGIDLPSGQRVCGTPTESEPCEEHEPPTPADTEAPRSHRRPKRRRREPATPDPLEPLPPNVTDSRAEIAALTGPPDVVAARTGPTATQPTATQPDGPNETPEEGQ